MLVRRAFRIQSILRTMAYIERLSQYMASTGKNYHSHYATIKSWIAQDATKAPNNKYDYDHTYEEGECL